MKRFALVVLILILAAPAANADVITGVLEGRVTSSLDAAGIPDMCMWASPDFTGSGEFADTTTGPDGYFSVLARPGSYVILFLDCSNNPELFLPEYYDDSLEESAATRVLVMPGGSTRVEAALDPVAGIEGTVTNAFGDPLPGVCIEVGGASYSSTTSEADGSFRVGGLRAGNHWVDFRGECIGRYGLTSIGLELAVGEIRKDVTATLPRIPDTGTGREGIRGRVTFGPEGQPAQVCVGVKRLTPGTDTYEWLRSVSTDAGGRYVIDDAPGTYKIHFGSCEDGSYLIPEWFDDVANEASATPIVVDGGEFEIADAHLALIPSGDIAVSILEVENVLVGTDAGPTPVQPGLRRRIHVEIGNSGPVAASLSSGVMVCPSTVGRCRRLDGVPDWIASESVAHAIIDWDATGYVGEVSIEAWAWPTDGVRDLDGSNNDVWVRHYAVIGGAGVGVGPPV